MEKLLNKLEPDRIKFVNEMKKEFGDNFIFNDKHSPFSDEYKNFLIHVLYEAKNTDDTNEINKLIDMLLSDELKFLEIIKMMSKFI